MTEGNGENHIDSDLEEELKVEEEIKWCNVILADIRKFQTEIFPDIKNILGQSSSGEEQSLFVTKKIKEFVVNNEIFSFKNFNKIADDEEFSNILNHDLRGTATIMSVVELASSDLKGGYEFLRKKVLQEITKYGLLYSFLLEDIIFRKIIKLKKNLEKRNLDIDLVIQTIQSLQNLALEKGLVRSKLKLGKDCGQILAEDEEIKAVPGVVVNALYNIIKNGAKEKIEPKLVNVTWTRESDKLVFRVADDGIGMDQDRIDLNKEGNLFSGTSGTKSTGLGLKDLDKRLAMAIDQGTIDVWSRKRKKQEFSEWHQLRQVGKAEDILVSESPFEKIKQGMATVFEIRLPITKKKETS